MSRIGRKPIPIPQSVKVQLAADHVNVQGPKGKLSVPVPAGIRLEQKDKELVALRENDEQRALHGLTRALVANAVIGVTDGFKKELDIVGVGYRAELKGKNVVLSVGAQPHLTVSGADKGEVAQVAANLRRLRPPDPYKQKGIRITGEPLKKKAGKAGAKTGAASTAEGRKVGTLSGCK